MNVLQYIKENGLKHTLKIIYQYKIDIVIRKILACIFKHFPLKDIIIIESHNDFDSNGGAFYEYLIKNQYHKKYRIVWTIKNKTPDCLPVNVCCVPLLKPSILKDYYYCRAKYLLSDNNIHPKMVSNQVLIYLTHGAFSLKSVRGLIVLPENVDYILAPSEYCINIVASQFMQENNLNKFKLLGYPCHDCFYDSDKSEINKITKESYAKVVIWMPTFRKGGGHLRNDSRSDLALGIPIVEDLEMFFNLNQVLKGLNIFLIIKIHPMQNLDNFILKDTSNIKILTGSDVKRLEIDNYRLIKCVDALISDYSSIAYDFLHLNKPLAYVMSDKEDYKLGFVTENINELLAGNEIYNFDEFIDFICNLDKYGEMYKLKRESVLDYVFKYKDGNSCERLAQFLGLQHGN